MSGGANTTNGNGSALTVNDLDKYAERLESKYGMKVDEYNRILDAQLGRCASCGTTVPGGKYGRFVVDHCHKTGEVRGLVCQKCNLAIGMLGDDLDGLVRAVAYLCRHRGLADVLELVCWLIRDLAIEKQKIRRVKVGVFKPTKRKFWQARYIHPRTGERVTTSTKCTERGAANLVAQVLEDELNARFYGIGEPRNAS